MQPLLGDRRLKYVGGISRTRREKGEVVSTRITDYTMCIHTAIGHARPTMQVLIAEFYETD